MQTKRKTSNRVWQHILTMSRVAYKVVIPIETAFRELEHFLAWNAPVDNPNLLQACLQEIRRVHDKLVWEARNRASEHEV